MTNFGIAFLVILAMFVVVEIIQLVRAGIKYHHKRKEYKENKEKEESEVDGYNSD